MRGPHTTLIACDTPPHYVLFVSSPTVICMDFGSLRAIIYELLHLYYCIFKFYPRRVWCVKSLDWNHDRAFSSIGTNTAWSFFFPPRPLLNQDTSPKRSQPYLSPKKRGNIQLPPSLLSLLYSWTQSRSQFSDWMVVSTLTLHYSWHPLCYFP